MRDIIGTIIEIGHVVLRHRAKLFSSNLNYIMHYFMRFGFNSCHLNSVKVISICIQTTIGSECVNLNLESLIISFSCIKSVCTHYYPNSIIQGHFMHSNFTILRFETSLRTIISDAVSRTVIYSRNATHCLLLSLVWIYNFQFLINQKNHATESRSSNQFK